MSYFLQVPGDKQLAYVADRLRKQLKSDSVVWLLTGGSATDQPRFCAFFTTLLTAVPVYQGSLLSVPGGEAVCLGRGKS